MLKGSFEIVFMWKEEAFQISLIKDSTKERRYRWGTRKAFLKKGDLLSLYVCVINERKLFHLILNKKFSFIFLENYMVSVVISLILRLRSSFTDLC